MSQEKLKLTEYFSSFDLALSVTISLYYPLEAIDWTENPHKAKFIFKRDAQLDQLVEAYWRGELKVNPQAYFNALKNLKGRLYESR